MRQRQITVAPHRRTVANALWVLANRGVAGVALVAAQALFARALRPEEVGLYHLAAFVGTLLATLGTLGLPSAATRFVAAELGGSGARAGAVARHVLGVSAGALAVVLGIAGAVLALGPPAWRPVAPAVLLAYAAAAGARLVAAGVVQGFADFRGQAVASVGGALVLAGGAAWVLLHGGGATLALAVTAAQAAVAAALLAWRARRRLSREGGALGRDARGRIARYAAGVSAMLALDAVVWQQSEVLVLRVFSPAAEVGFYAVAFTLVSQAMQLLPGSAGAALFPALAHAAGEGDPAALRRAWTASVRLLAVVSLPLGAVGAVLAPALLRTLYGEAFLPAAAPARLLWASGAVGALAMAASSLLYALERQRAMVIAALPVAAVNLGLDLLLIPRHAALGAAVANAVAQGLGAAAVFWLAARAAGQPPWASLGRVVLASAVGAAAAGAAAATAGGTSPAALALGGFAGALGAAAVLLVTGELRRLLAPVPGPPAAPTG